MLKWLRQEETISRGTLLALFAGCFFGFIDWIGELL